MKEIIFNPEKQPKGYEIKDKRAAAEEREKISKELESLKKEKEKEGLEEKIEEKKIEEIKTPEKLMEEKRKDYGKIYLEVLKRMKKEEMKIFSEIRKESENEIKEKVREIIEAKAEESEKKKKELAEFLNGKFKEKGFQISQENLEKILEVEVKKGEYEKAKREWVRAMKEKGMKEKEIILALAKELEALRALEVKKWPPEKRSIFAKALDGWMKLPRWKRVIFSSLILTGTAALFPGILPSTAALCSKYGFLGALGFRAGRGFLSGGFAQVVGKAFEKFWGLKRIEKKKLKSLNELAEKGIKLENFEELDSKIQEILNETAKSERKMKVAKGLLMLASGVGASMALTVAAEEVFGGAATKEGVEEVKKIEKETFWTETIEKGESPLSEAKKIYMEHAKELGYKGDLSDKVALERWAEIASTRHIVGQYIIEHQEEFKSLIEKIGPPPNPSDPEYFAKLDEWLSKVPKSTFEDILHHKVPNLVYEGDKIVVTKSGDILAYSPEGKLRLGHISIAEVKKMPPLEVEGKKPEALESLAAEKEEKVKLAPLKEKIESKPEAPEVKEMEPLTSEKVREILWEKFKIVTPAYENIRNERILNLITEEKYQYSPGVFSGMEDVIAKDIDTLRKQILRIYNSLPLEEKAEAQLMTVDEFLRKYLGRSLEI